MSKCLECGKEFKSARAVMVHAKAMHGLNKLEYNRKFGLCRSCLVCGSPVIKNNSSKTCSAECNKKHLLSVFGSEKSRRNLSVKLKAAHAEGRNKGWSHVNSDPTRMSFPEKVFDSYLRKLGFFDKYSFCKT